MIAMSEKPILFNTEMVKVILSVRKTMTRRKIDRDISNCFDIDTDGTVLAYINPATGDSYNPQDICRYKKGDIIWVKETWKIGAWNEHISAIAVDYKADNFARREWITIEDDELFERYWIQSTDDAGKAGLKLDKDGQYHWNVGEAPTRWRPSIFMPRAAARLFLRVKSVRVERLQDITEEDAQKEGCMSGMLSGPCAARGQFEELWNSTIKKKDLDKYGWDANPWVWMIEFERMM